MANSNHPPIPWDKTFWDWQAIDADGSVCTYAQKPTQGLRIWVPVCQAWMKKQRVDPPTDFTKCIWQRPQNKKP